MPPWWGTRQSVTPRLREEVGVMRAAFGDTFKLVVPQWNAPIYWLGNVEINLQGLSPRQREHVLKIMYPHEFPERAPEAYVEQPHIYSEKHQFEDGQLCLFNPKDGSNFGWNPSTSTAVTITGWAIQWLYAYYTWRLSGQWPGQEERVHKNPDGHR